MQRVQQTLLSISVALYLSFASAYAVTFPEWQAAHFTTEQLADPAISGETADPDGDGCGNLLEYAFGRDPLAPDSGAPSVEQSPSGLTLTTLDSDHNELTRTNNSTASGIIIERTEDGAIWRTVGVVSGSQRTFTDASAHPANVCFYRLVAFN